MSVLLVERRADIALASAAFDAAHGERPAQIALLGTGTVGSAFVARYQRLRERGVRLPEIAQLSNSRVSLACSENPVAALEQARAFSPPLKKGDTGGFAYARANPPSPAAQTPAPFCKGGEFADGDIIVDATASDDVAARHAEWLAQGIHVVTACKLGQGTSLQRWREIRNACAHGDARYGDSATVGAGLPLLRTLRELQAGGDRIHAIAGVLSGSLAWLFDRYDGMRPFSGFVREAREAGYTEPDPREDLSGEDVRRKLLILARSAGIELESTAVEVESLVPHALASLPRDDVDAALESLDAPLRERYADAWRDGRKLRYVARLDESGRARVGLETLDAGDALLGGSGSDNRVAIWSDRYRRQPLLVQGPGAGAAVTAAALLDDVLAIQRGVAEK